MILKEIIFRIDEGEYHSFDAFYKKTSLNGNALIIPYINLGIYNHPLSPGDNVLFISKCFVVLKDIKRLKIYKHPVLIEHQTDEANFDLFFGGSNMDQDSPFIDMDVKCNTGLLLLPAGAEISDSMWIPVDTPNFKTNMISSEVDDFFQSVTQIKDRYGTSDYE